MSKLKDENPTRYAQLFKYGVERADQGRSTACNLLERSMLHPEEQEAQTDGFTIRLAVTGSKK